MQKQICEILKDEINASGIAWLDVVCGKVETLQVTGGTDVVKRIPAYRNTGQAGCDISNDYVACHPNTDKKSIIYMETGEPSYITETSRWMEFDLPVTIVCWLNLKQINIANTDYTPFASELINAIPEFPTAQQPFAFVRASCRETKHTPDVFSNYDYDEPEQQYLTYPFDHFALTVNVRYRFMLNCYTPITNNPSPCKTY
jgi:hypothetical protein